jgi:hypothetical protein
MTIGTVRDFTGFDGCRFLVVLEDGSKLEPIEILDKTFVLRDGQKVQFDYEEKPMASICMAGKTVVITCIRELTTSPCPEGKTIKMGIPDIDSFNKASQPGFSILEYSTTKGRLNLKIGYSGCSPDRNFGLIASPYMSKSLPPQRDCKLLFEQQVCAAYFTKDLCFDISRLDQTTILILKDQNKTYNIKVQP